MEPLRSPPTAGELSALNEAFQRNPASGFVALGEAFLSLGRPQEAIEAGARGLRTDPDNYQGRMMVARAFSMLHQWKEAQAELLKVVKAHRDHYDAFRMLGEVLMRRNDFERALPVLQHAQNLAPTDPDVLTLLRHARSREPLGPPEPVPVPISPAASEVGQPPSARPGRARASSEPPPQRITNSSRPRQSQPPPAQGPAQVRPRVVSNQKPVGVAQASLRMSASVGEGHLPFLLSSGLVAIPNVRAARIDYRIAPVRRFGRSLVQLMMTATLVTFVLGIAGIGWYWITERTKAASNRVEFVKADESIEKGTQAELMAGTESARTALERTDSDSARALYARNLALRALLFGDIGDALVKDAVGKVTKAATDEKRTGHRNALIAHTVSHLLGFSKEPRLETLIGLLEKQAQKGDSVSSWVLGRAYLAMGRRAKALKALQAAHGSTEGLVWATIDLGEFQLDEGDFDGALKYFDQVLARDPKPELAYLGRALARAERGSAIQEAMSDISVGLAQLKGSRAEAKRALALVAANLVLEDYESVAEELKKAQNVHEVRWLTRKAMYELRLGHIKEAEHLRKQIQFLDKEPDSDPLLRVLDADIAWFHGRPRQAERILGDASDVRAQLVRGKALFDRRLYDRAAKEFAAAREAAPDDRNIRLWAEASRLVLAKDAGERTKAMDALDALVRESKDNAARVPAGLALLAIGDYAEARRKLEGSLQNLTDEFPNTLQVRSRVALGQALLFEGKPKEAAELARAAIAESPGFQSAEGVLCRALARMKDDEARKICAPLIEDSPDADVLAAWAIVQAQTDKEAATATLRRAKEAGASPAELETAIKMIDPALFEALGVPKPR